MSTRRIDHFITCVEHANQHITRVYLHDVNAVGGLIFPGTIRTRQDIIQLINNGAIIRTVTYNYNNRNWNLGAQVITISVNRIVYIKTESDSTEKDNLGNLLPFFFRT